MRLFFPLVVAMFASVALAAPASAQADPHSAQDDAEAHYQAAVTLFGEARYREALDEFDAAIAISPESIFFCNRAIVLIQLAEVDEALEALGTCQRTFAGDPSELAAIDAQRQAVAVVVNHVRPSAFATISAINAPTFEAPPRRRWNRSSTGYVLLAAGGALLASAATLDLLSSEIRRELEEEARGKLGSDEENYLAAREAYLARQRIWLGLAGAGALSTLAGAALVGSWLLRSEETVSVGWGLEFFAGGLGLTLQKSF